MATFAARSAAAAAAASPSSSRLRSAASPLDPLNEEDPSSMDQNSKKEEEAKFRAQKYLTNCKSLYSCIHCRTHLANHDELVSRSFQGNHGRAYLFNSVINIACGQPVQRQLNTGSHAVADIYCSNCEKILGWKYEKAFVETQKYKEGKYIIELAHVVRENRHLELDKGEIFLSRQLSSSSGGFGAKSKSRNSIKRTSSRISRPSSLGCGSSPRSPTTSGSQMSSPTDSALGADSMDEDADTELTGDSCRDQDEDDDLDEELMFPFYDDLCSSRSSYPGNLSLSQHDRARRSLYLGSKPYDWKAATSSSSSAANYPRMRSSTTTDRLSPPPSSTSKTSSRPESSSSGSEEIQRQNVTQCQASNDERPSITTNNNSSNNNDGNDNRQADDAETQFKLDDDHDEQEVGRSAAAVGSSNNDRSATTTTTTIKVDDEEFYDCYSEHDLL